jgi:hypothetical protein
MSTTPLLNPELWLINRDIARVKEEQLKELSLDSQHQSQKTQQLLWFFGAVSAIIFSQEWLSNIPQRLLWVLFTMILLFIWICIKSFFWRTVTSMIKVEYISDTKWTEQMYLEKKIEKLNECQSNLRDMIKERNDMNNTASLLFAILIVIYAFIFLIHNTNDKYNRSATIQVKWCPVWNFNPSHSIIKSTDR